jgi:hypothetical protein
MDPLPDRISDDRRRSLNDALTLAVGQGRIDLTEFSELTDAVWSTTDPARFGRLEQLVAGQTGRRDPATLAATAAPVTPHPGVPGPPAPQAPGHSQTLWFGDLERRGDMQIAAHENLLLIFGDVDLDRRDASLSAAVTELHVTAVFGDVRITVPPGIRVDNRMSLVFGDVHVDQGRELPPGAPVLVVTGHATFGDLRVSVAEPGAPMKRSWWSWLIGE